MAKKEVQYPELILDVFEMLTESLVNSGIDEKIAHTAASEASEMIIQHWAGASIYVPANSSFKRSQRDEKIYKEFTGKNYTELGIKYGLSSVRIRKIIKKMSGMRSK